MQQENQEIISGNARDEAGANRGWFTGHFLDARSGLRASSDVEMKWGEHVAGECRTEWAVNARATTLSILIRGRFRIQFPGREILLEHEGDYALWAPGVPHTWIVEESSTILTVRWPSLPNDSIPASSERSL